MITPFFQQYINLFFYIFNNLPSERKDLSLPLGGNK